MKKFWIQISVLTLGTFAAIYFGLNPTIKSLPVNLKPAAEVITTKTLKVNSELLSVEIVDTPSLRAKGLGGRQSLDSNFGMLFIFDKNGKHQFWMKGMRFGLDLIFIDHGRVVDILANVPNPNPGERDESLTIYQPTVPVNMVLEVNSGYVATHDIKIGDNIYLVE